MEGGGGAKKGVGTEGGRKGGREGVGEVGWDRQREGNGGGRINTYFCF